MRCVNCGTENAENAKFCKSCGTQLVSLNNSKESDSSLEAEERVEKILVESKEPDDKGTIEKKSLLGSKKGIIGFMVIAAAFVVALCLMIQSGKTINLNKYVVVSAEGYDGYGKAEVYVDWNTIEEKYGSKISFTSSAQQQYSGLLGVVSPVDVLRQMVRVNVDKDSKLSNGDVLTYSWTVDEDILKNLKCRVKYKDGKYSVSDLVKLDTFDAFKDLTVEFTGIAPNGMANINYEGSEVSYYDFICDKSSELDNGDVVTVSIDEDRLDYYAETLGKIPEETSKEYTVDGLDRYIVKLSEIDEKSLDAMKNQASDTFNASVAQSWSDSEILQSFTYLGNYLLTRKTADYFSSNNELYLIYKAQVRNYISNENGTYDKVNDIFWYIGYEDVLVDAEGKISVVLTDYMTPYQEFRITSTVNDMWSTPIRWRYEGYGTLDELYKAVVTSRIDFYNHEDNVSVDVPLETANLDQMNSISTDGYIISKSNTELLTKADLDVLSAEQCKLARNEIYARHGRKFKDETIQAYFDSCSWYTGTIEPDQFKDTDLNDIEIANRDFIVAYENEKGYR